MKLVNTFSEEAKNKAYYENEKLIYPDEDLVMQVAEHWSINPSKLEERKDIEPSLGLLGQRK